jgi:hypothetical protein
VTIPELRPAVLVAAAVAALSLAGCGGTASAGSGPTHSNSSGGAQPPASSATSPAGAGSAKAIDVCKGLPAASAAQLSGQGITTADSITEQSLDQYGCAYGNDDDSVQVEVTVFEHNAATSYDYFLSGSKNASTVGGLGDKAFFDNDGTMYVLAGNALIQVNGLNTADECAALARPIVAAL